MERCSNGHYYDTAKHTSCPYCGVAGLDIGKTTPKRPGNERPGNEGGATRPKDLPAERGGDPGVTRGIIPDRIGIDPAVGWLVCIDGPDRGMDYRIRSENNSIGRSETMRICIAGDETIARENHAFVSYDPESNGYMLLPGSSSRLVFLNRGPVYAASPIRPFDEIKLGNTTLLFIALCGDFGGKFRWA